jgi:hypothetical protein
LLIVTTILGMGRLDKSIFAYFHKLDAPHNAFKGMIRFTYETQDMSQSRFKPGSKGRACRNWYNLQQHVHGKTSKQLYEAVHPTEDNTSSFLVSIKDVFGGNGDKDGKDVGKEASKAGLVKMV